MAKIGLYKVTNNQQKLLEKSSFSHFVVLIYEDQTIGDKNEQSNLDKPWYYV